MFGAAPREQRIALAVSGGPDSMAMLALATAAFPGQVVAATVDHGLRADSAAEAAMVARCCAALGVSHATLPVTVAPGTTGNLHSWARQQRYRLLYRWCVAESAGCLATAHHADDQAETFLMRAARGSGVAGLAAVRARREIAVPREDQHDGTAVDVGTSVEDAPLLLLRPLLGWRRGALRGVAVAAGLPFVDDPSNTAERFDRARFRRWVEDADWIDPLNIARAAGYVAEAEADLATISGWFWSDRARPAEPGEVRIDMAGLPREIRRRLVRIAIESVRTAQGLGGPWTAASNVESLLDALGAGGRSATQAGVMASAAGDIWHFREAPARRSHSSA
nr:tRNA lysidine(34) synthetase TilS [Sphingomonas sp. GC_Shp_3]